MQITSANLILLTFKLKLPLEQNDIILQHSEHKYFLIFYVKRIVSQLGEMDILEKYLTILFNTFCFILLGYTVGLQVERYFRNEDEKRF